MNLPVDFRPLMACCKKHGGGRNGRHGKNGVTMSSVGKELSLPCNGVTVEPR